MYFPSMSVCICVLIGNIFPVDENMHFLLRSNKIGNYKSIVTIMTALQSAEQKSEIEKTPGAVNTNFRLGTPPPPSDNAQENALF